MLCLVEEGKPGRRHYSWKKRERQSDRGERLPHGPLLPGLGGTLVVGVWVPKKGSPELPFEPLTFQQPA